LRTRLPHTGSPMVPSPMKPMVGDAVMVLLPNPSWERLPQAPVNFHGFRFVNEAALAWADIENPSPPHAPHLPKPRGLLRDRPRRPWQIRAVGALRRCQAARPARS
jgi:hypothetical protein